MSEPTKFQEVTWQPLTLSTGFFLSHLLQGIEQLATSQDQIEAIQGVTSLFAEECIDADRWSGGADKLAQLISRHPERLNESGTWHDGAADLLAMAATMEAARAIASKLYRFDEPWVARSLVFKAFKYVIRAYKYAGDPEKCRTCLTWLERLLELHPHNYNN